MKYVSLDIETTSLVPSPDNILQVAMVAEDSDHPEIPVEDLPFFVCLVSGPTYTGEPFALQMNAWILKLIALKGLGSPYPIYDRSEWAAHAKVWLASLGVAGRHVVAGKNVAGFDLRFMPPEISGCFRHRVIDPGSLFIDWTSAMPPSLDDLTRQYLDAGDVSHDALEDARDVVRLLRKSYPSARSMST